MKREGKILAGLAALAGAGLFGTCTSRDISQRAPNQKQEDCCRFVKSEPKIEEYNPMRDYSAFERPVNVWPAEKDYVFRAELGETGGRNYIEVENQHGVRKVEIYNSQGEKVFFENVRPSRYGPGDRVLYPISKSFDLASELSKGEYSVRVVDYYGKVRETGLEKR